MKTRNYRVKPGRNVDLKEWPTHVPKLYESDEDYVTRLKAHVARLRDLQPILYADHRHALLVIFQAMDAGGKDGVIEHVMSGVNPQGCNVHSFKHPGPEALKHDFLWEAHRLLPERGYIGIFNRSYYEEVLIVRVHRELLDAQSLPEESNGHGVWKKRYRAIRGFERHLHDSGTRIVKIFLHLSQEEQRKRLLSRLDEPDKNWKFDEGDLTERAHWDDYMRAYEACLGETSAKHAPWYVVPADDKHNARLIVSRILIDALEAIPMSYPEVDDARRAKLAKLREQLESADRSDQPSADAA